MASSSKRNRRTRQSSSALSTAKGAGQVRIISGRWRGRRLVVPEVPGLRPSGDRVRETLFNWLQGNLAGACCLDLFAGTGALALEALSRYACSATIVELDTLAMGHIRQSCENLGVAQQPWPPGSDPAGSALSGEEDNSQPRVHLFQGTAQQALLQFKQTIPGPVYDLVFIDPPFQLQCQWEVLASLAPELLAPQALVYVEAPSRQAVPDSMPTGFERVREKMFSEITATLVQWNPR